MSFVIPTLIGVVVFLIGQYLLKMVIEPIQAFRAALARLSNTILRHQAKITNATVDDELSGKLSDHSAEIVSAAATIMFYRAARLFFRLPKKTGVTLAARSLNHIAYSLNVSAREWEASPAYNSAKPDHARYVYDALTVIRQQLGIKTSYED